MTDKPKTIRAWAARDEDGEMTIHSVKPKKDSYYGEWLSDHVVGSWVWTLGKRKICGLKPGEGPIRVQVTVEVEDE